MNNKNIFSNIALLLLTLSCHFLKENVTLIKKDYLNILWVDKTLEDNRKLPQEEISLRNKESKTLLEKSLALKKKKQFSQSIQLLENAIDKEKIVQIPWSVFFERKTKQKVVPATLEETMLQVASHSTYHRGQINTRFRELGGDPASVDFIVWVWMGKPRTDLGE